jgi:hypothetical protein
VGPSLIVYSYNTLSGNQPSTYGNTAFLWQNGPFLPYNQTPLASQPVSGNSQSGSVNFSNLQIQNKDYIVGYSVGPNVQNICSWAYIPPGGSPGNSLAFQTMISMASIATDGVVVNYETPDGNAPQSGSQWIGIWQGPVASYTTPALAQANVSSNVSAGQVPIPVTLLRGTQYTVAYFMGAKQTMMAATCSFTTSS